MTGVSSWGENAEDAFDQCLVEMGLGDVRIIKAGCNASFRLSSDNAGKSAHGGTR